MNNKKPVFWHQGLFLQPQHLQLQDLHNDTKRSTIANVGLPYFWGVMKSEVSSGSLDVNLIEISDGEFLFKDGAHVSLGENARLVPRAFDDSMVRVDKALNVYIGIKKLSAHEPNVTVLETESDIKTVTTRFVTTTSWEEVRDIYGSAPDAQYRDLTFVVRLFWDDELEKLGDYELIHVDRLVRDGEKIHSALNFVPPTVALAGSSNLTRMLRDVRDEIVGRSKQLEEYKSPREMQKSEFDASYMTFLLALRSLNRYGPRLFHLIDNQLTHPWHVYGVLREIVGELSSFSDRHSMTGETSMGGDGLPSYDHGNIGRCVHASLILIRQLLNEITIGPELIVQLLPDGDFLAAELPRRFVDAKNECYFVLRTEEDPESVVRSFQSEAKVASRQELPNLINRSLPGVEVTHLPLAPQGLPRRSFSLYFGLSKSNDQWSDVERSANIALYWANAPADVKIELVVLRN